MSLDRLALEQLEYREVRALLLSCGADITYARFAAGSWRVRIGHCRGHSEGYGADLLEAVLEAAWATEQAGGLELLETAS